MGFGEVVGRIAKRPGRRGTGRGRNDHNNQESKYFHVDSILADLLGHQ